MLRRIDNIKDSGFFRDFQWSANCPDFERLNIIYGGNGSGKTSLTCALDQACNDASKCELLTLSVEDNSQVRSTLGEDVIYESIFIFNSDYVDRNHWFSGSEGPEMSPVLTIGQRTSEAEDELVKLRKEQSQTKDSIDSLKKQRTKLENNRLSVLSRASENIVSDLTKLGGIYQSRSHYNVRRVEERLDEIGEPKKHSVNNLSNDRSLINAPKLDEIEIEALGHSLPDAFESDAMRILKTTATTVLLDSLKSHPNASRWVEEGAGLHNSLNQCIFCGSDLTEERKKQIDLHFSGEVAALESEIRNMLSQLQEITEEADSLKSSLPIKSALYADLQDKYEEVKNIYLTQIKKLVAWLETLQNKFAKKLENVIEPFEDSVLAPCPKVLGDQISRIISEHNQRSSEHDRHVQDAANRIEEHHLAEIAGELRSNDLEIQGLNKSLDEKNEIFQNTKDRIATLENIEGDPMPSVSVLNEEVARLLGRNELTFETDGSRYRVLRNGEPAIGLSEGEKTAITLIHFMESVARHDNAKGLPIVIIDDPVSSLDSTVFLGVSTYIWSEYVVKRHAEQLFILTHNLELFRQWDIQIEGLHRSKNLKREFPAKFYQLTTRHKIIAGVQNRLPVLSEWPPSGVERKKVRSSYLHSFITIANEKIELDEDPSLERLLDAQLLFPNVIRRMLEGFIGFKRPELAGNFTTAMREFGPILQAKGYQGDPESLRLRLTRFTHAYSHGENPDTTATIDPAEIVPTLAAVFEFMYTIDSEHLEGLCEVARIEIDRLVERKNKTD